VSAYRNRGYFIRSPRSALDPLKAAAMAALFALDLLDMH
jgi:hypothetical protein